MLSWRWLPSPASQPRHVNMQDRGLAIVERGKATRDRFSQFVRLGDTLAVGAERFCHARKIAPFALTAGHQARLELIGLGRDAPGINALHGRFHRLPAAIVE